VIVEYLQHVASSGSLSLAYPGVFQAFAANFVWSLGAVDISSVQSSVNGTVNNTQGNAAVTLSSDDSGFISPYGVVTDHPHGYSKRALSLAGLFPDQTSPHASNAINRAQLPVTVPGIATLLDRVDIRYPTGFLTCALPPFPLKCYVEWAYHCEQVARYFSDFCCGCHRLCPCAGGRLRLGPTKADTAWRDFFRGVKGPVAPPRPDICVVSRSLSFLFFCYYWLCIATHRALRALDR
jgi:hypothetical protein